MKEDKSASETTSRREVMASPEASKKTRLARPAPRTDIDSGTSAQGAEVQQLLNGLLADEFVLYVRTLNYHWNVRGMQFHSLHAFFEKLYKQSAETIDDVAEKVRSLGGYAVATLQEYLNTSRVKEQPGGGEPPDPRVMISNLAADHGTVIKQLREAFKTVHEKFDDPSTENFLTDLLEQHEKTMWMLNVHLDRELG
jgi:starvation-inducible DNA-binding protein